MSPPIDSSQVLDFFQLQQEHVKLLNGFALLRDGCAALQNQLSMALQTNAELRIENQTLRDEIDRLKHTPPRPKIPPGGLENSGRIKRRKG